ncbi:unnamed protein product, partial [Effrenium voratum]
MADVAVLRHELQEAETELELRDAELRACNPRGPGSCDDPVALHEEYRSLQAELGALQEQAKRGQSAAQETGQRQRMAGLEEELRQKCEVVRQLRQRELWFELQLRRQQEAHGDTLDALRDEAVALRQAVIMGQARRPAGARATAPAPAPAPAPLREA